MRVFADARAIVVHKSKLIQRPPGIAQTSESAAFKSSSGAGGLRMGLAATWLVTRSRARGGLPLGGRFPRSEMRECSNILGPARRIPLPSTANNTSNAPSAANATMRTILPNTRTTPTHRTYRLRTSISERNKRDRDRSLTTLRCAARDLRSIGPLSAIKMRLRREDASNVCDTVQSAANLLLAGPRFSGAGIAFDTL